MTTEKDAPMPPGVMNMSKQELWNWFHRSTQAAAEQRYLRDKFFAMTTGLHSARSTMLGDPAAIIEAQRARIHGLELQMAQMQKGYDKKLRKAVAKSNALGENALGLLRRVRMKCLGLDAAGEPTFEGSIDRGIYDEMNTLLLECRLETLPAPNHGEADSAEPRELASGTGQLSVKAPGHA
jgi:hypothetical protein